MSTMLSNQVNFLTVIETADLIGVTEGRVRQLLGTGELKGVKFGSQWAIAESEAKRFAGITRPPVGRPRISENARKTDPNPG